MNVLAPSPASPVKPRLRGVSHQVAFFLAIAATAGLVARAAPGAPAQAAFVFGAGLVVLFGVSALYHRVDWTPAARARVRSVDHAAIFVLIAAGYTPLFALVPSQAGGHGALVVVWAGASSADQIRGVALGAEVGDGGAGGLARLGRGGSGADRVDAVGARCIGYLVASGVIIQRGGAGLRPEVARPVAEGVRLPRGLSRHRDRRQRLRVRARGAGPARGLSVASSKDGALEAALEALYGASLGDSSRATAWRGAQARRRSSRGEGPRVGDQAPRLRVGGQPHVADPAGSDRRAVRRGTRRTRSHRQGRRRVPRGQRDAARRADGAARDRGRGASGAGSAASEATLRRVSTTLAALATAGSFAPRPGVPHGGSRSARLRELSISPIASRRCGGRARFAGEGAGDGGAGRARSAGEGAGNEGGRRARGGRRAGSAPRGEGRGGRAPSLDGRGSARSRRSGTDP